MVQDSMVENSTVAYLTVGKYCDLANVLFNGLCPYPRKTSWHVISWLCLVD